MTTTQFIQLIIERFGFTPTGDQHGALDCFARFLACRDDHPLMVMRGSAGTGKTSLVAAMVQTLLSLHQKVVLMAPTGRAAKVLSLNSDYPATTIHRKIYREKTIGGEFSLDFNSHKDTLFIIDEASMIATYSASESGFGSGNLLDDVIQYVYGGQNCRMMLIGDTAQLPPVGEDEAPALMSEVLYGYGVTLFECGLHEVLRQSAESGILWNATVIRHLITHDEATELPRIRIHGFADICVMPGNELIESLANSYARCGLDDTAVITRSNKRATIYNNGIRNAVLDHEGMLTSGDQLMVVKNNYYWTSLKGEAPIVAQNAKVSRSASPAPHRGGADASAAEGVVPSFIANGDRAIVRRVRNHRDLYGFHFVDVLLRFPDYDDYEMEVIALTDTLQTDAPALTREQSEALFNAVAEDYADIRHKPDRLKAIREDKYFNALQIKYAYAVTCHKAQGGQWSHVYVDQGYMTDDMLTPDYIHWLYTAFTRATEKLFLVNWPKEQVEAPTP